MPEAGDLLAACGVSTAAVYMPGFHRSVDNDLLWGAKWTEWVNLRDEVNDTVAHNVVRHPLRGYYDIWDNGAATLKAQAREARAAGVRAFMFYHYWFPHGRTLLSRPLEEALLGKDANDDAFFARRSNASVASDAIPTGHSVGHKRGGKRPPPPPPPPAPPPSIGMPFFFSWANEAWEKRFVQTGAFKGDPTAGASSMPRTTLIPQGYGTVADWEAHFEWLLRFFRHPDYVRVDGAPLMVIYDASDFSDPRPGDSDAEEPLKWCAADAGSAGDSCGGRPTPLGCAAAELYLRWYPHFGGFLTVENAHAFHKIQGEQLGYVWPKSDPCAPSKVAKGGNLLPSILATWQRMARERGLTKGLRFYFTFNHQANSKPKAHPGHGAAQRDGSHHGYVQFMPMSLVSQSFMVKGWPWGAGGNFYWGLINECFREESGLPLSTNLSNVSRHFVPHGYKMRCDCLLRHVESDELDERYLTSIRRAQTTSSPMTFVRGAFPSWSNYPRGKRSAAGYCRDISTQAYRKLLQRQLERSLADAGGAEACAATASNASASSEASWQHLVLVNSWNEWGEQGGIEPSVQDGTALLDAHREAIEAVTSKVAAARHRM